MAQLFVTLRRADIPAGTLAINDLTPTAFMRTPGLSPVTQGPYYCRPLQNETSRTVTTANVTTFVTSAKGLTAYLLTHVEAAGLDVSTGGLTVAQAAEMATDIIAAMRAGDTLDLAAIDALIAAVLADTELSDDGGSNSTGSVADVMAILSGQEFTVPAGTVIQSAADTFAGMNAATTAANFNSNFRRLYSTDAFEMSATEGNIAVFSAATFSYKGVTGAAITTYDVNGELYNPALDA